MTGIGETALLCLLFVQSFAAPQPLNDVVIGVSRNVNEFWDLLPDFVCNEKITSTTYESGKSREEKIVESIFTSGRKTGSHREITAIDGKPAKKNAKMPGLPVDLNIGFAFVTQATFTPRVLQFHDYSIGPKPDADGKQAVEKNGRR